MGIGFENIKKDYRDKESSINDINDFLPEIKDMMNFLQQRNPKEEIDPMIKVIRDIYDLPEIYKNKAIDLIKNEGKTPTESYLIVMEEDDDRSDPDGSKRDKFRRDMGLI